MTLCNKDHCAKRLRHRHSRFLFEKQERKVKRVKRLDGVFGRTVLGFTGRGGGIGGGGDGEKGRGGGMGKKEEAHPLSRIVLRTHKKTIQQSFL